MTAANNDMLIIYTCMAFFVISGFAVGLINQEFNTGGSTPNVEGFEDSFIEEVGNETGSSLSFWKVIAGVLGMFFWTFGQLPLWLDLLILLPRLLFWITIARNVWVGGGG